MHRQKRYPDTRRKPHPDLHHLCFGPLKEAYSVLAGMSIVRGASLQGLFYFIFTVKKENGDYEQSLNSRGSVRTSGTKSFSNVQGLHQKYILDCYNICLLYVLLFKRAAPICIQKQPRTVYITFPYTESYTNICYNLYS